MSLVSEGPERSRFANRESDRSDMAAVQEFLDEALITQVLNVVKSGKEATVYRCRAHKSLGVQYAIAKVYHSHAHRGFQRSATYEEGRVILNGQLRRAVAARTEFGRNVESSMWVDREFDLLSSLNYAGVDVPTPFVCNERAILMEEVGDADGPAIQLQHAQLEANEAQPLLDRLLWNIEAMIKENVVHADLSPFNILYSGGRCTIIDLPQAVDPRQNSQAEQLLERDLTNVLRYFARYKVEQMDPRRMAHNLFELWRHGEL